MVLVPANVWILRGHGLHSLIPVGHADGDAVRFSGRGHVFFRPCGGQIEGELKYAINARASKHRLLQNKLPVGTLEHASTDRRVFALGVLAHYEEVDIARLAPCQWAW